MNKWNDYHQKRQKAGHYAAWLWRQMKPTFWLILFLSLVGSALSLVSVGIAWLNKHLIDLATAAEPAFSVPVFALLVVGTFLSMAANSGLSIAQTFLYERFSFRMRRRFYRQILHAEWLPLSRLHSGDLMTRITADIDTVASGIYSMVPSLVSTVVQFVSAFALLYYYDATLTLLALAAVPLGLLLSALLSRVYAAFQRESRENESQYRSFLQESVENLMVAKSFSQEDYFEQNLEHFWKKRFAIIKRRSLVSFWMNMAMSLIFSGGYLLAFGWSIWRLSRGEITYGTVSLLLMLVARVQAPVQSIQGIIQQMVNVLVSAGRVMEVSEMPRESKAPEISLRGPVGIAARGVTFAYPQSGHAVLKNLSFVCRPGETIGIIGESGAGKTTLVRLILSLVRAQEGSVMLFDQTGMQAPVSVATRKYISYVPQGNTMLSGTIRENLMMGDRTVEEARLWEALELAEAADFVRKLPQGLDAVLLENGGALSEGQAQRLSIARALVRPGSVLILDEATASLDISTETRIVRNLQRRVRGLTTLIITHRPSLLDICHHIYEIRDGELELKNG